MIETGGKAVSDFLRMFIAVPPGTQYVVGVLYEGQWLVGVTMNNAYLILHPSSARALIVNWRQISSVVAPPGTLMRSLFELMDELENAAGIAEKRQEAGEVPPVDLSAMTPAGNA